MAVYQYRKGRWTYDFLKHGVRIQQGGFASAEEAEIAQAERKKELKVLKATLLEIIAKRKQDLQLKRTPKHFNENEKLFDKLVTEWGHKDKVTRDDIEEYCARIAHESRNKANKHLRLIKALFGYAVKRGLIDRNPALGIDPYPVIPPERYVPPLDDVIKTLDMATPEQRHYLLFLINTMARVSEINTLKWQDIHDNYLILRTRKAKNSNLTERKVPLNRSLREILAGIPRISEYVFINAVTGNPYCYRSKFLRTLCRNAKVLYFSFHALRHLGASRLVESGVPITDIQQLLGHARTTTTDIYLRTLKPSLQEAVEQLSLTKVPNAKGGDLQTQDGGAPRRI